PPAGGAEPPERRPRGRSGTAAGPGTARPGCSGLPGARRWRRGPPGPLRAPRKHGRGGQGARGSSPGLGCERQGRARSQPRSQPRPRRWQQPGAVGAQPEPSLYTVKALLVLDSRGQRLLAKYYDGSFPTAQEQAAFESSVFSKTRGAGADAVGRARLPLRRPRPRAAEGLGEALAAGEPGRGLPGAGRDRGQGGDPGERPAARAAAPGPAGPRARSLRLRALRLPGGQPRAGGCGGRRPPQVEAPRGCSPPPGGPEPAPTPGVKNTEGSAQDPEGDGVHRPPAPPVGPPSSPNGSGLPGAPPAARLRAPPIKLLPPAPPPPPLPPSFWGAQPGHDPRPGQGRTAGPQRDPGGGSSPTGGCPQPGAPTRGGLWGEHRGAAGRWGCPARSVTATRHRPGPLVPPPHPPGTRPPPPPPPPPLARRPPAEPRRCFA
uniref:Coatomer subunit zeta n=1 Tax=Cairina moschata TaxID=8855 RepID=A0A8C3C6J6_CAIMO